MEQEVIEKTIESLKKNHFDVFFATNTDEARDIFFRDIFPQVHPQTVSWGDSETMKATGVLEELRNDPEISIINTSGTK